jgi:hypothetical protein
MKEIELFNGDVLEFPDDTPDEVLDRVAKQETSALQMSATQGRGTRDQREAIDPAQQAQAQFEALPWYGKAGQAVEDVARMGVEGLTFGHGDKLGAKMGELVGAGSYDDNLAKLRAETQGARDRMGMLGTGVEIGGQILGPSKILGAAKMLPGVGAVGEALSKIPGATKVATVLGKIPTKTASAVGGGAALGALDAAGHDRDIGTGAIVGGAAGLAGRALAPVVGKVAGGVGRAVGINKAPKAMSQAELQAAKTAAYETSENIGLVVKQPVAQKFVREVEEDLAKFGYLPENQPGVGPVLKRLQEQASREGVDGISLKGLDQLRQMANNLRGNLNNRAEGEIGRQISKKIDKMIDTLDDKDVFALNGNKTQAVLSLREGRKYNRALRTSQMIQEAIEKATNTAAVGGHPETALKSQFRSILNSPGRRRFLTEDERAAMQAVVRGTKGRNLARLIGRLSPQHPLGLLFHAGSLFATGGLSAASFVGGAAGVVGKAIGERGTKGAVAHLDELARAGGLESSIQPSLNAVQRLTKSKGGALVRGAGVVALRPDEEQY